MTHTALTAILTTQYRLHRDIEPRDIYKLLYQAVFGPEHSIDDPHAAVERLYLEVLHLPTGAASEPLTEPLSSLLCRVNLQPFMQQGGDVRRLWHLVRDTVSTYQPGALVDVQRAWKMFLTTPWARQYDAAVLEQFWLSMASAAFPPVHHSRAYAAANAPHYRVVLRSLVEQPTFPL